MILEAVLAGAALPAAVSAAACFAMRARGERAQRLAGALAVAGGFALAWLALSWAPVVPERAWQWLPALGLAAAAVSSFEDRVPGPWTGLPRGVVALAAGALLVPVRDGVGGLASPTGITTVMAVAVPWTVLSVWGRQASHKAIWIVCLGWALGAAGLLELCSVAKFAQLAGVVAATAAPALLLARHRATLAGAIGPLCVLVPGLIVTGRLETFEPVPLASFVLVAIAPLAVLVAPPGGRRWPPVVVAAVLVAVGLGLAAAATF